MPESSNNSSSGSGQAERENIQPDPSIAQRHHAMRILLVEDDSALASLEAGILAAQGLDVVTVYSGELAIQTLRRSLPDLVVLDLELTGTFTGRDVLDVLRTPRTPAIIPVLLTTSSTTTARAYIRSQGESKQTLDYLPKPYPMQTLLKRVRRMLQIAPS